MFLTEDSNIVNYYKTEFMNHPFFLAVISGFLFGVWPLLAVGTKVHNSWMTLLVSVGTAMTVYIGQMKAVGTNVASVGPLSAMLLLAFGVINGTGIILYGKVLTMTTGNTSSYMAISFIAMTAIAAVGGMIAGEGMSLNKGIGMLMAVGSLWFLNKA